MSEYVRAFCSDCLSYTVHAKMENSEKYQCVHCMTHPKIKGNAISFYFRGQTYKMDLTEADSVVHQLSSEIMDFKLREAEGVQYDNIHTR